MRSRSAAVLLAFGAMAACSTDLTLEGRPCPCADQWTCCERLNRCVSRAEDCGLSQGAGELTRLYGVPGGKGQADGVGTGARFESPGSIVRDEEFLYVADQSEEKFLGVDLQCVMACWPNHGPWFSPVEPEWDGANDCLAQCPRSPGPATLLRRITLATGQVESVWVTSSVESLGLDGAGLYASVPSLYFVDNNNNNIDVEVRARAVLRVDPTTGAHTDLAGRSGGGDPRDGQGVEARFGDVRSLAADGAGKVYLTDLDALRVLDVASGSVTTLLAGEQWRSRPAGKDAPAAPFVSLGAVAVHHARYVYAVENGIKEKSPGGWQKLWKYDAETGQLEGTGAPPGTRALCIQANGDPFAISGDCVTAWWFGVDAPVSSSCDSPSVADLLAWPADIACGDDGVAYVTAGSVVWKLPSWVNSAVPFAGDIAHEEHGLRQPSAMAGGAGMLVVRNANAPTLLRLFPEHPDISVPLPAFESLGGFAVSATGRIYASATWGGVQGIWSYSADVPALSLLVGGVACSQLLHDGAHSLYCGWPKPCSILAYDDRTGAPGEVRFPAGIESCPAFAPGGADQVFIGSSDSGLFGFEVSTGRLTPLPAPSDGWSSATALAYDPRGILYVAEGERSRVMGLAVETGEVFGVVGDMGRRGVRLGPLPAGLNTPSALAVLPDGTLAIADQAENVVLVARRGR